MRNLALKVAGRRALQALGRATTEALRQRRTWHIGGRSFVWLE